MGRMERVGKREIVGIRGRGRESREEEESGEKKPTPTHMPYSVIDGI